MIFVDSNVPMYLVGAPHPVRDVLEGWLRGHLDETFVTSAEVYQEVIHRYVAIDRRRGIADAFKLLDSLVTLTFDVGRADVDEAHRISLQQARLSARDCLHLATMARRGVDRILTADRGFDAWPGIERLPGG